MKKHIAVLSLIGLCLSLVAFGAEPSNKIVWLKTNQSAEVHCKSGVLEMYITDTVGRTIITLTCDPNP